jgi:membrane protease subunit (stomatin/prohibitin family)
MGLGSWIGGQFIDIIEWTEPSQNEILAHRFTRHKNDDLDGVNLGAVPAPDRRRSSR